VAASNRVALGGYPRALRPLYDLLQSLRPVGKDRRLGSDFRGGLSGLRGKRAIGRQFLDPGSPARGERKKGGAQGAGATGLADLRAVCLGRSRGGLTTKIHVVTDARGLPIALKLTPGQAHDGRSAEDMLDTLGAGQTLIADAAYDSDRLRDHLQSVGAHAVVKPIPRRTAPPPLDRTVYRRRNRIERFFARIKHFRAIATRYEKHDANYLALLKLAASRIWIRAYESSPSGSSLTLGAHG
jgi:transposase